MYIRIEQIKEDGLALEFEEKPQIFPVLSEMINQGECEFVAPIKTALKASRIGDMIELTGEINTVLRLPCGRCLKEYETPLKSRFELTYVRRIPGACEDEEQEEVEISAAEMGLIYFQGEEINLQNGIQEQVILAFPIKALCRENCKGLCASCGNDLNEGDCSCDRQAPTSKFAALKNLKLNNQ
ncbi:MAG: DUF177 domain-containing protein [Deltaproteobacteria bacterium]|jgi:uncharacterized protein|nr:DUF177 domain-containing protein [Deltaproteobacteria bacterium]